MDMMGNALGEVLEGNQSPEEALSQTESLIERRIRR
jgi:multiple sugar transport system substrate-binding protein